MTRGLPRPLSRAIAERRGANAEPLPPARDAIAAQTATFAFVWAGQALVHQEFSDDWLFANDWTGWLVSLLALALFVRPRSVSLLALLATSSVVYNIRQWPFVSNHILLESLVNLALLCSLLRAFGSEVIWSKRLIPGATDHFFALFAPVARGMLITMYYFAFIAKLNWDFLNPNVSCAATMYGALASELPWLPNDALARGLSIVSTLAIEGALPVLLTIRATRCYGLLLGLPFHFVLGAAGHQTFSALVYGLYSLFISEDLTKLIVDVRRRLGLRFGARRLAWCLKTGALVAVVGVLFLILWRRAEPYTSELARFIAFYVPDVLWAFWSLALMAAYGAAVLLAKRRRSAPSSRRSSPGFLFVFVALVFANGISQYLGLKTASSFTMYSNLRTEGGSTNHLFMPLGRIARYQDDLVEIVESNEPKLSEYRAKGQRLPYFEFRRIVSDSNHDLTVSYRRNAGELRTFTSRDAASDDWELSKSPPSLVAALLYFRPVDSGEHASCQH